MSHAARRRVFLAVFVAMLALAVVGAVLALADVGGWFLVGAPLSVSFVALAQLVLTTDAGVRTRLTPRRLVPVVVEALLSAAFLVVAGVIDGSTATWFLVALLMVGLVLVGWSFWLQVRRLLVRHGSTSTIADERPV